MLQRRLLQALGVLLVLAGLYPLWWGLSVVTGLLSYNFGHRPPPLALRLLLPGSVLFGGWAVVSGTRLCRRAAPLSLRLLTNPVFILGSLLLLLAGVANSLVVRLEESELDRIRGIDLPALRQALDTYASRTGRLPDDLRALVDAGILEKPVLDPWEREYRYERRGGQVRIGTFGKDGAPGGVGPDADVEVVAEDRDHVEDGSHHGP